MAGPSKCMFREFHSIYPTLSVYRQLLTLPPSQLSSSTLLCRSTTVIPSSILSLDTPHRRFFRFWRHYRCARIWMNANPGCAELNANRYKYFKWTPRNAWLTLLYVGIVPSIIGYVAYSTDVSALQISRENCVRSDGLTAVDYIGKIWLARKETRWYHCWILEGISLDGDAWFVHFFNSSCFEL